MLRNQARNNERNDPTSSQTVGFNFKKTKYEKNHKNHDITSGKSIIESANTGDQLKSGTALYGDNILICATTQTNATNGIKSQIQ